MGCWNGSWNRWLPAVPNNADGRNVPDIERWFLGICCPGASSIWMYHPTSLSEYCFVMLFYPLVFFWCSLPSYFETCHPSYLAQGSHLSLHTKSYCPWLEQNGFRVAIQKQSRTWPLQQQNTNNFAGRRRQQIVGSRQAMGPGKSVLLHAAQGVCGRGLPLPWSNVACHARWTKKNCSAYLLSEATGRHVEIRCFYLFLMFVSSLGSSLSFWIVLWQFRLEVLNICDLRSCKVQGPEVKLHKRDCSGSVALLQFSNFQQAHLLFDFASSKPQCRDRFSMVYSVHSKYVEFMEDKTPCSSGPSNNKSEMCVDFSWRSSCSKNRWARAVRKEPESAKSIVFGVRSFALLMLYLHYHILSSRSKSAKSCIFTTSFSTALAWYSDSGMMNGVYKNAPIHSMTAFVFL